MATFGEMVAKAAAKVAAFAAGLYRFVKLLLFAAITFSILGTIYLAYVGVNNVWDTVKSPFVWVLGGKSEPEKPIDEKDLANQVDCFTAIIAKDVEGELAVHVGTIRLEIADAVLRLRAKHPSLTICDVMKKGLTFFPIDWDHKTHSRVWQDRSVAVIRAGQTNSAWVSAQVTARGKYGTKAPADRCATHYIRAAYNYLTTPFSGESGGAAQLLATMGLDPNLENSGFKTKFLCPK